MNHKILKEKIILYNSSGVWTNLPFMIIVPAVRSSAQELWGMITLTLFASSSSLLLFSFSLSFSLISLSAVPSHRLCKWLSGRCPAIPWTVTAKTLNLAPSRSLSSRPFRCSVYDDRREREKCRFKVGKKGCTTGNYGGKPTPTLTFTGLSRFLDEYFNGRWAPSLMSVVSSGSLKPP